MTMISPVTRAATGARRSIGSVARALGAGVMLAVMVFPAVAATKSAAIANSGIAPRFKHYLGTTLAKPARLPLAADPNQRVTVVVRLASNPVSVVRAQRAGHGITEAERTAIHDQIDREQAGILPTLAARGAQVLGRFSDAVNGIKVQIDRSEIEGLASLPGVVAVMPVTVYHMSNVESVPFIGAPAAWQGDPGFRGAGVKIAVIDTGIDYTHADFGGPGSVAAFTTAAASSTLPADPTLFGPNAPKVKGGIDLVGDLYDAGAPTGSPALIPKPDLNPLDCNGHGSHVSGTAAGFGVGADGKTYRGAYDSAAYGQAFQIGPGVAPQADLYAVRVFGCGGSSNVIVDAINWAVANDMDVISMSLGSDFGSADTADALAVKNAVAAGILVVSASGNAGPTPYIASSPASGVGGIAVAAMDSHASFPGALVALAGGGSIEALVANGAPLTGGLDVVVLRTPAGGIALGCTEAEYIDKLIAGKLVVTRRGVCARVLRAQLGQKHGAAAVAMINAGGGYPPYEGAIAGVTIPFFGVLQTDTATLTAAAAATSFAGNTIANPTFKTAASFSSAGPRFGDSALRPNVTAPGVSIFSTRVGSGNGGLFESGTSMATPHVAGVAALVREAHPEWEERAQRAAVVDTADPAQLSDYAPRIEGAGLVQPLAATRTQAVVVSDEGGHGLQQGHEDSEEHGTPKGLSFGFEEFARNFSSTREVSVHNYAESEVRFNVTATAVGGSPHTVHLSRTSLNVDGGDSAKLRLTLSVPAATVGSTHDASGNAAFREVAGYLTFTPADGSMNNGVTLHVPYYLVPRARSNVFAVSSGVLSPKNPAQNLRLGNVGGALTGNADFYAWGLSGTPQGIKFFDTKAVGVQSNQISADDSVVVFAINTFKRFSNSDAGEFDILIDTNGDGVPDYDLAAFDQGLLTTGSFSGVDITVLVNLATGALTQEFLVDSPTDGSTLLLPVLASDMGISPAHPRFTYSEITYNLLDGTQAALPGSASFNVFSPSISNAQYVAVAPGASAVVPVAIDPIEWQKTPARGLMVVVEDNFSGSPQAQLIPAQ